MPGKRRLRFSKIKNYERKKSWIRHQQIVSSHAKSTDASMLVSIPVLLLKKATCSSSKHLLERLQSLNVVPADWILESDSIGRGVFSVVKIICSIGTIKITITSDCQWTFSVNDHKVPLLNHTLLQFNEIFLNTCGKVEMLVNEASQCQLCVGNPDVKFFEIRDRRKGKFMNRFGETIAFHDIEPLPSPTIRNTNCLRFIPINSTNQRCAYCDSYRKCLFALVAKAKHVLSPAETTSTSSHVNYRYLSTPQKVQRLRQLSQKNRQLREKIRRLQRKLDKVYETSSVLLDDETSQDLQDIMDQQDSSVQAKYQEDSFEAIFWRHQKHSLSKKGKDKNGNRWHPLMIRWCLYLRHCSSKAYEVIRESGCIALPSQRTLRDYSNAVKAGAGFSSELDEQLLQASKLMTSASYHALVFILLDEMHIREELVFDKHTGKLIGFVDLGSVNNHLSQFEQLLSTEDDCGNDGKSDDTDNEIPLAKSMMVFMVRGIFTTLRFPYALFPCCSLVGEQLFSPFWECVFRLERIGFKVLGTTFDGASVNRRLIAIHDTADKQKVVYKLRNIYADEERYIYCFSDPPHLIKTTRNCFASKNRSLWNNGKNISWQHVINLYENDNGKGSGLSMVMKLRFEHLNLTSFAKMRVDLAAQVLSESVGKAMELTGGPNTSETSKFILNFDKFFDVLNVSNFTNGGRNRKPFQQPYYSSEDSRLKWLEEEFVPWLDSWEESVAKRSGWNESQKKRMLLSSETLLGIRRTVKSFVEFVQYIFTLQEVQDHKLTLLSNHICQDPLENFFGCQRQRGGTSDNPSVSEFYLNTQALRVINSFCRDPIRGNCRGATSNRKKENMDPTSTPLMKRRRYKNSQATT